MLSGEIAGVVPAANWNSLPASSNAALNSLVDDLNASAGNITWSNSSSYTVGGAGNNAAGNRKMLNGYIDTDNATTNTFTVTNLPAAFGSLFTVVVYADGDGTDNRFGSYSIAGAGAFQLRDNTNAASLAGTFDDATLDNLGNYLVFSNVPRNANGGFVLSATPTAGGGLPRAPVNGIQILIPEPTAELLGAAGLFCLMVRRRRQSAAAH